MKVFHDLVTVHYWGNGSYTWVSQVETALASHLPATLGEIDIHFCEKPYLFYGTQSFRKQVESKKAYSILITPLPVLLSQMNEYHHTFQAILSLPGVMDNRSALRLAVSLNVPFVEASVAIQAASYIDRFQTSTVPITSFVLQDKCVPMMLDAVDCSIIQGILDGKSNRQIT